MSTATDIQEIYVGLLGRAADKAGLAYWINEIDNTPFTIENLRANIVNEQQEYKDDLGSKTRAEVVVELYSRMFERTVTATEDGVSYWITGDGKDVNVDQLVLALSNGAGTEDKAVLNNKTEAAVYFSSNVADGKDSNAAAKAAVDSVDGTAASVTASKAATDATNVQGGNFTLTTGTDAPAMTAGDDTVDGSTPDSLTALDKIIDSSTTDNDTLNATLSTADVTATIKNVENVNINWTSNADLSLDAVNSTGNT